MNFRFFYYLFNKLTSVIRTMAVRKEGLTRFIKPESPAYYDGTIDRLFPFSYSNGVLDISYDGNDFKALYVDIVNIPPGDETETAVAILSGPYLVTSLGNNFKSYIRSWRDGTIDAGSPIEIYIAPQVFRVQEADYPNIDSSSASSYKK